MNEHAPIPWTHLAGTVELLQGIMRNAMEAAPDNEEAAHFMDTAYTVTDERARHLLDMGIDVNDERQLFIYVSGFAQSLVVAHTVMHAFHFQTAFLEDDEVCHVYVASVLSNIIPLMPLLPLHLILKETP